MKKKLLTAGAIIFWIAVWQIAAMAVGKSLLLASPVEVVERLASLVQKQEFWQSILYSTSRIMLGFICGMTTGVIFAVISSRYLRISSTARSAILIFASS